MNMHYNRYMNENTKLRFFVYKNNSYNTGTKFIFTGYCLHNQKETFLKHAVVTYMYSQGGYKYFKDDDNVYAFPLSDFEKYVVDIVKDEIETIPQKTNTGFYWTDDDVTKTLWYIIIMLFATLFYERIVIWILATIIWYCSVFGKKK